MAHFTAENMFIKWQQMAFCFCYLYKYLKRDNRPSVIIEKMKHN